MNFSAKHLARNFCDNSHSYRIAYSNRQYFEEGIESVDMTVLIMDRLRIAWGGACTTHANATKEFLGHCKH